MEPGAVKCQITAEMLQRSKFDPDSGKDHPLAAGRAIEEKNVRGVRIKGRRQVDQQEAHLVDVAAKVLAGKPVAEFVDCADHQKQDPKGPYIVGALIGEGIKRRRIALHPGPIPGHKIRRGNKQEDAKKYELSGVHPAEDTGRASRESCSGPRL